MTSFLEKYKHYVGFLLLVMAIASGIVRFDGSWKRFYSMVLAQLWFGQAVYNYLRGGWVGVGPGGMGLNADPVLRRGLAGFAFFLYLTVFFFSSK